MIAVLATACIPVAEKPVQPASPIPVAEKPVQPTSPNIVFIFADDWGWGDLSSHGHPWLKTPHLDLLAREGIDFHQFNVLNPVCSPSRAAALTGQYPARYSIHEHFFPGIDALRGMPDWLDPKAPTIARFLKKAGYRTAHFGKWNLTVTDAVGAPDPTAYGFDEFSVFSGPSKWKVAGFHDAAQNAVRFIHTNKDRPFFVDVWLHEVHTPHVPTQESLRQWKKLDEQKRVYAAVVTDGDKDVGKILAALKDAGVEQNTIVLFASDNGPEVTGQDKQRGVGLGTFYSVGSTGGLKGRKRSLFEGGVRTPFIVRWPGHTPAGRVDRTSVIAAVDFLPTLCAAAGITLPASYRGDGENRLPAITGKPTPRTKPLLWEWRGNSDGPNWPRLGVRAGNWKLVMTYDKSRVELYNVVKDLAEAKDVAADHPDIVKRLTKMALDWKATLPKSPPACCRSKAASFSTSEPEN